MNGAITKKIYNKTKRTYYERCKRILGLEITKRASWSPLHHIPIWSCRLKNHKIRSSILQYCDAWTGECRADVTGIGKSGSHFCSNKSDIVSCSFKQAWRSLIVLLDMAPFECLPSLHTLNKVSWSTNNLAWVSSVSGEKGKDGSEKRRELKERNFLSLLPLPPPPSQISSPLAT